MTGCWRVQVREVHRYAGTDKESCPREQETVQTKGEKRISGLCGRGVGHGCLSPSLLEREKGAGQGECNGLCPVCLTAINSLRRETETNAVARCLAGTLPHSEEQI